MDLNQILPEILNRNSSVCFSNEVVSADEINLLIEATKWAPSSRNMQPWKIVFATKRGNSFDNVLSALYEGNQEWAINSDALVIFCAENDEKIAKKYLDIGFSGQNMMLQAEKMGIASHSMGGWDEKKVKEAIKAPSDSKVIFILAIGKKGSPEHLSENLKSRHESLRTRNENPQNFSFDKWDFHSS